MSKANEPEYARAKANGSEYVVCDRPSREQITRSVVLYEWNSVSECETYDNEVKYMTAMSEKNYKTA